MATGLPNTDKLGLDVDTGAHPRIRPTSSRYLPHFFRLEGQLYSIHNEASASARKNTMSTTSVSLVFVFMALPS